ncbi:hypothetical protein GJAV_G00174790 [Gymnothorax javanicus]|nr:hypothetical protein GJAV_G00174790 [Gymnothorax javanicus]
MADEDRAQASIFTSNKDVTPKADEETPSRCSVDTQTMYCDSDTQTKLYTPRYVPKPGTPPELLTFDSLKTGHGLPAGLSEMEKLEFARRRKAQVALLPPFNDLERLAKREKMMIKIERERWTCRENLIQRQHGAQLIQLSRNLWQRGTQRQLVADKRLENCFSQLQQDKATKIKKLHKGYFSALRRLTDTKRTVGGVLDTPKIMKEYSAAAKQVFRPCLHKSHTLDLDALLKTVKNKYLSTDEGLKKLEDNIPASVIDLRIDAPKPKSFEGFVKRADHLQLKLMRIHQTLKAGKQKVEERPHRFLGQVKKPRFPHLLAEHLPEEDAEDNLPIIFLQKALKGTSVMALVYEGKEKRLDLIQQPPAVREGHSALTERERSE